LSDARARDPKGWIVCQQPRPEARLRLLCLPFAGGGSTTFRGWQAELPDFVEVCAVQLPGRERRIREPAFTELRALVPALAAGIAAELDRPFAVLGHSMGGLVGYELARWLRAHGGPLPAALFVSGRQAPPIPEPEPPIHGLSHDEFVAELRAHDGTPEEVLQSSELLELILPTVRADFSVCETYVHEPGAPLDCPIVAFGADDDPEVPREDLLAWRAETAGRFDVHTFQGGHFFIQSARAAYLRALRGELERLAR